MESEIRDAIMEALMNSDDYCIGEQPEDDIRIRTFEDAGILTHDAGFTITLMDGSEFQVTIKQSR